VDEDFINTREELILKGDFDHPMFESAKIFADADSIVIGAPFWDLSFPAVLKQYLEQTTVRQITFFYTETGIPQGLCKAKKLYYVTTAGGPVFSDEYGYGYVKALADGYYGIPETKLIKAEGLDMEGSDVEEILRQKEEEIDRMDL
jgi:FMN-dependent NADH-azoreductase